MFAKDVLNRYAWTEGLSLGRLVVVYRHVSDAGSTRTIAGSEIVSMEQAFFTTATGSSIPYHRVLRIYDGNMLAFDKEAEREKARAAKGD